MGNKTSTGYRSTGNRSTGNRSTGDYSTGNRSTGDYSTGDHSTGDYSTGYHSTGNYSTGHWSISHYSTGHFSTIDYSGFGAFNKPCTPEEWGDAEKPDFLYFNLTEWVHVSDMTDQEKEENPTYEITGGYLKVYDYKEAFQASYSKASDKDKALLLKLPNFDAEVFYEISGIRVEEKEQVVKSVDKFVTDEDGKKYKLIEVKEV